MKEVMVENDHDLTIGIEQAPKDYLTRSFFFPAVHIKIPLPVNAEYEASGVYKNHLNSV